jgi:hypothetical protein
MLLDSRQGVIHMMLMPLALLLAPTRKRGYLPERFRDGLRRRWTNADPGFGFWIGVGFRSADA